MTPPPAQAHRTVIFCDDETGSYAAGNFHAAAAQVATWVTGMPQANTSGATIYAQWIESNSYADDATYNRYDVAPVPYDPSPPGPVVTAGAMDRDAENTAIASATIGQSTYERGHAAYQAGLRTAQTSAASVAKSIQRMPRNLAGSSDIWGCLQRATERFGEVPNDLKYLVIASDMEPVGQQERARVDLHGVRVLIIYFETSDVGSYDARVQYWTKQITAAGGAAPAFYRPDDQLPTQPF